MQDIRIGRYSESVGSWSGWIEPDDRSWIIYLDEEGKPALYWPERDETGAVLGYPTELAA